MKSIVVCGYAGFIGVHVTKLLLQKGCRVFGIDKFTYAANSLQSDIIRDIHAYPNFTHIQEDICNLSFIPDCDFVVNLAAESHVGNSIIDCKDFIRTNVDGVRNLLTLLLKKPDNVRKRPIFLHISSDEVYGDIKKGKFTEESPLNPSNSYSASKASADLLIQAFGRTHGLEWMIARPTNNYGCHQSPEKLIPLSVRLLQDGHKIRLHDGGKPKRCWLHANDTAEAIWTLVKKGSINNIYNIGGNDELENIDVARMIVNSFLGMKPNFQRIDDSEYFELNFVRPGQDVRYAVNDSKLRKLGWQPQKHLSNEIFDIVQHYKKNYRWR